MKSQSNITIENKLLTLTHYCALQERCTQDVLQKMSDIGVLQDEKVSVLEKLIQEGFLNDERYACAYVRGKFKINHWGKNKIKAGLYQKNIPGEIIQKALTEIETNAYYELAQTLATKQLPKIKAKNDYERQQKLRFYLSQKGFESEVIGNLKINKCDN